MSSGAGRLTQERKITFKTYSNNKIHTILVYRKFTNELYVIWVKKTDMQQRLDHRNLSHVAIKKIKGCCKTKHLAKEQIKKCKRKANELGDDDDNDKSVYIRENLADNLIHYINVGVIEPDDFRKNLGITNNHSI